MNPCRYFLAFLISFFLAFCPALILAQPDQQTSEWNGDFAAGWQQYDQLTKDKKYDAASSLVEKMLADARTNKDNTEWTRCLIRYTQLRIALRDHEASIRFLKDQPWPEDSIGTSVLHLYYAHALNTYAERHWYEINKREKTDTQGTVDIKAWTYNQIFEEIQKTFENVWKIRSQLGEISNTQWSEYLIPNNFSTGIRPTLRDSVSYLWVGMLADTKGWRPDHLNGINRPNLKNLIKGNVGEWSLVDPTRHPLEKICFILADLENWHAQKKEREAALEARLERYRYLHWQFGDAKDREFIQSDLENYLKPLEDVPWWAEGMAQLAEFIRSEKESDSGESATATWWAESAPMDESAESENESNSNRASALIRARQIAIRGEAAYPESYGGKKCRYIRKAIEAPEYSLNGMLNDNPQKKSLLAIHKNLDKLYFRAYPIDLIHRIETPAGLDLLEYGGTELERYVSNNSPSHQWEVKLPATPDYRLHRTFVIPPMTQPGTYLIIASARPGFPKEDNELHGLCITISDLVIVSPQSALDNNGVIRILSGANGRPVAGAEVMLYQDNHLKESKLSDERGMVRFTDRQQDTQYFLVARHGDQIAYDPHELHFYKQNPSSERTLIFTDRSVYRPLQKIFWKAVLYNRFSDEARFETSPADTVTVSLKDPNKQVVESRTVTTNSFGTASGEFNIPAGHALGQWYLESSQGGGMGIRVEEYKRPTFEIKILDPKESLRLNQLARIKGEATYYFGNPLSSGQVRWSVKREPVFPWWWRNWLDDDSYFRSFSSQMVAGGTESLKEDGTFSFTFLPQVNERLGETRQISYRYSVSVDVTDEGGETHSTLTYFRIGFVSVAASVSFDKAFFLEKAPIKISVFRNSMDGIPKAGKGTWRIARLETPSTTLLPAEQPLLVPKELKSKNTFLTPGDRERERWRDSNNIFPDENYNPESVMMQWKEGSILESGSISHDKKGEGVISVGPLPPGAYRLIYETFDDFGEKFVQRRHFVVAGTSMQIPLPAILEVENSSVKVGGKARILVHSGFKNQFMILERYRGGKCIQRKEMISGKDSSVLEIPITEEDRGGMGILVYLLRDNQFIQISRSLSVPWDNKELKVEFSTFRDRLRPGREESWTVKVTDPAGKDAAVPEAELAAYMYDRSLDTFTSHWTYLPIYLFPDWTWMDKAKTNLTKAEELWLPSKGFRYDFRVPILTNDRLVYLPEVALRIGDRSKMLNAANATSYTSGSIEDSRNTAPTELRSDFSETAFWKPHLLTGPDGSVTFEFKVPDSVTSWNVWVHAITKDLKSGSVNRQAQSVKELMVRPYLPRFLREGDQAEIKVVVNNASDKELKGSLNFDIIDTATDQSVLSKFGLSKADASGKPFSVAVGGGTNLAFPIKTPSQVGQIAFKVTATSGDFTDGELRPIPVLPGRMHLMQSRFVTLKDQSMRVMKFDDLARNNDPSRINEQMVVTLDAQLFYSVLSALPYLVNYPYECTEQTMNRFLSTGILSSLYKQYPAIDRMAKEFSSRKTQFEQWDAQDPNRKMALEETPWLQMAQGSSKDASDLLNVLDSRIVKAQRESALAKLRESQTSSGGFPWFPGGPPSPYMTLYLLNGFSKALEFGVEVPREMVKPAWDYMHRHYLDDVVRNMMSRDCGWEFVTFINYVLSSYPDDSWYKGSFSPEERKTMLDFSFKHWKSHSPYLKGYLALTLKREGRAKDAMLVWESVMDSAKTAEDQGTFWAPEDRAWLWYNDTIESHAFAIRTDMELIPEDPKLDGMVLWLFLNKKMNHWKSTRATAEVIYSLAHYLKKTGQLGIREDATVTVGNQKTTFVFEPDQYTGKKNQIVIPGEKIDPAKTSSITVEKTTKGHMFASATWHFSTEQLPEEERGDYLRLSRTFFKRTNTGKEFVLQPLKDGALLEPGDEVEVHLSLTSKHPMEYVHLRDPRGAGFEPSSNLSKHKWDLGLCWYEEIRDSGTNFFFEHIPQGEFTFKYRIRATTAGTFQVAPATVQPMYAPEFTAYSTGAVLKIATPR